MTSDRSQPPLRIGEVFPRLRLGSVVGVVLGLAAAGWCRHYLLLARAGGVPRSVTEHGLDDPRTSYAIGLAGCVAFVVLCVLLLVVSYLRPLGTYRASR